MKLQSFEMEKKPKIMIIPMIDIIFFLLVFFMMSMLSMVVQRSVDLSLPQTASAKINRQESIPISITADGTIYVEQEKIGKELLGKRISVEKKRNPDVSFIIRADSKSSHENFVYVLDELKSIGVTKIGIATTAKPGESK